MSYSDLTLLAIALECISMAGACGLVLSIAFGFPAFMFEQEDFYKWLTVGIVSLLLFASTLAGAISFKNKREALIVTQVREDSSYYGLTKLRACLCAKSLQSCPTLCP